MVLFLLVSAIVVSDVVADLAAVTRRWCFKCQFCVQAAVLIVLLLIGGVVTVDAAAAVGLVLISCCYSSYFDLSGCWVGNCNR